MKIIVVIPAYNESRTIGAVIDDCKKYADEVIVANDGSADETESVARAHGARVVTHIVNRGYGAALKTGIIAALKRDADSVVTIDADGQHEPQEIQKIVAPLQNGEADIVIGNRFASTSKREGMSILRKLFILIGNTITWLLYGTWIADTQSGFRAYTRNALDALLNDIQDFRASPREVPRHSAVNAEGMEFSSEVIGEAVRLQLRIALVPITIRYTAYSLGKGQNILVGAQTAFQLILRKLLK
jgi:glycosyltransferase involved in cell wall biosynthesis